MQRNMRPTIRQRLWRAYYLRADAAMYLIGRGLIDAWRRAVPAGSNRFYLVGILKNLPLLIVGAWVALLGGLCHLLRLPGTLKAKAVITFLILFGIEVAAFWFGIMGGR